MLHPSLTRRSLTSRPPAPVPPTSGPAPSRPPTSQPPASRPLASQPLAGGPPAGPAPCGAAGPPPPAAPGARPFLRAVPDPPDPPRPATADGPRDRLPPTATAGPRTCGTRTDTGPLVRDPPAPDARSLDPVRAPSRERPLARTAGSGAADPGECAVIAVTADPWLADQLAGVAAAAGVRLRCLDPRGPATTGGCPGACRPPDPDRPVLILMGADAVDLVPALRPSRGGDPGAAAPPTVVVSGEPAPEDLWRRAMELGAENVAVLPRAQAWLLDRVLDAVLPVPGAAVLGVTGGRGGSGTSTLAVALALTAAGGGLRPALIDADPLGGGLDLALGAENMTGVRWPELLSVRGRLAPGQLCSALPGVDGVSLLSWDRRGQDPSAAVPTGAVTAVLEAATREFDLVVLDLPRRLDPAARAAAATCQATVLLVPAEVRAGAAAGRIAAGLEQLVQSLVLVVRGPSPTGLPAEAIASTIGVPLVGELRSDPDVAAALDRGEPPPLPERGALSGLCRRLLTEAWPL